MQETESETDISAEHIREAQHGNGSAASGTSSPPTKSQKGIHHRSVTIDNAYLLDERRSLEHDEVDEDRHSLPSLENLGDNPPGLSSSVDSYLDNNGDAGIPAEVLGALSNPSIEDNTPAAEALRANAEVHVRKLGKLARSMHAQTVRRFVKKATLRAKSGNVRGKPPRIPPPRAPSDIVLAGPDSDMYVLQEEDEAEEDEIEESEMDSSIESSEEEDPEIIHDQHAEATAAGAGAGKEPPKLGENRVDHHHELLEKEPDWQTHIKGGIENIPAEVLTATVETGKKVLNNVDPHDILQTHRWKRRKRRINKDKRKSYVKGKVINGQHELYTLSIAVILGVRTSIASTNAKMGPSHGKRWLTSDDFMAAEKYEFSPKGGPRTPPHQLSHTFKFKDYSPMVFAYLRRMFGVNEFDFLLSVCGNANFIEFISNAKSGQFFFYSSDGKYMIKTMTNVESKFLRRILPHYFRHCAKNPNTLVTKFLGMYRVKMYHLRRNVKFVIMNSVYYTDKYLQTFYDLKGSVLGRDAKPHHDVKKDNDLRRGMPDSAIALAPDVRARMRTQIVADCEFMRSMEIMDYSMLIGIHHIPPSQERSNTSDSIAKTGFTLSSKRRENLSLRDLMKKRRANSMSSLDSLQEEALMGALSSSMPVRYPEKESGVTPPPVLHKSAPSVPRSINAVNRVPIAVTPSASSVGSKSIPNEKSKDSMRQRARSEDQHSTLPMYEQGYEDDDDCSYLEGSEEFKRSHVRRTCVENTASSHVDDTLPRIDDIERKKAQTVEQIYWPFHRYYDIYGYRRMTPNPCTVCDKIDCSCLGRTDSLSGLKIPSFEPPLSQRKDGGLMMDTTGFELPAKLKVHGKEQLYEGKIFYMGIIDILQQYNIRKRFEAKFRRLQSSGWHDASCVDPTIYADRFVNFFDEYSKRNGTDLKSGAKEEELGDGEELIVFEKNRGESSSGGSPSSVKIMGSSASSDIEVSHLKQE